jgi:Family of unknown function (DUF6459)
MTASRIPSQPVSLTTPIIDCEPPPVGITACPPPTPAALHRRTSSAHRPVPRPVPHDPPPSPEAMAFADAAVRRILEVVDRRRPIAQLRPVVAPTLIDTLTALTRVPQTAAATLQRCRVRMVDIDAGELFATYTRGQRVLALAGRIECRDGRWRIVALQLG